MLEPTEVGEGCPLKNSRLPRSQRHGIRLRMPAPGVCHPKEVRQTAHDLFIAGNETKDIAAQLGLPWVTVRQWSTRGRWMAEKKAISKTVTDQLSKKIMSVSDSAVDAHLHSVSRVVKAKLNHLAASEPKRSEDLVNQVEALEKLNKIGRLNLGLSDGNEGSGGKNTFNFNLGASKLPEKVLPAFEAETHETSELVET